MGLKYIKMKTEQQLLDLKKQIDQAKSEVSELNGREKRLMEQLQKDWGCKTVKEAEKKIKDMETDLASINEQIHKGVEELEEKYDGR